MFPHYFEGRKLVPLSITGLSLFQLVTHITRKREWRTRQRQTDNFWSLMCFFFFFWTDVSEAADRWPGRCLRPLPTPRLHQHHLLLIDLRAGCQGGSRPRRHCCLLSASSHVSLHATLLILSSAGGSQPENMLEESVCGRKAWMTGCVYMQKDQMIPVCLMYSGWVPHPNYKSWIGSLQNWLFRPIQPCYIFVWMADGVECTLSSMGCHYVKLMSITGILVLAPSSDWTQSIDLHLLSITEMVKSPCIVLA